MIIATNIFLLVIAIINISIAIWVWLKNPKRTSHWSFLLFVLGAGIWTLGKALLTLTHNFVFGQLTVYGGVSIIFGFVLLAETFPQGLNITRRVWVSLIPLFLMMILIPTRIFIAGTIILLDGSTKPINGPAFPLYAVVLLLYVIYASYVLFKRYGKMTKTTKLQTQYLIFGICTMLFVGAVTNILLPAFHIFNFNFLGPASSIFIAITCAYAIGKHRLLDIRLVIQLGTIYSFLLIMVLALYFSIVLFLNYLINISYPTISVMAAGIATLIGIFGVPPLERYFRRVTDKVFYKDFYDYRKALTSLGEILNQASDTGELIEKSVNELKRILKVRFITFILDPSLVTPEYDPGEIIQVTSQEHPQFTNDKIFKIHPSLVNIKIEMIVPLLLTNNVVGFIVLGEKVSGDSYNIQDVDLLKVFSYQAAVSLEKARLLTEVKEYSNELENRVKDRTAEIEKLQQEQQNLFVDMSHAIQTPLTVLKGELDFLKLAVTSNIASNFERSVEQISKLAYGLLKLSRMESSPKVKKAPVNVSRLIEDSCEYLNTLCQSNNIQIIRRIEPNLIIEGNKRQIEELFTNLASNAIKYIANKRIISVILYRFKSTARLSISDTGIGIDPSDLPYVFNRFYRTGRKSHNYAGTGLGLAISKKIVQRHNGLIKIDSTLNVGTMVTVELPLMT